MRNLLWLAMLFAAMILLYLYCGYVQGGAIFAAVALMISSYIFSMKR